MLREFTKQLPQHGVCMSSLQMPSSFIINLRISNQNVCVSVKALVSSFFFSTRCYTAVRFVPLWRHGEAFGFNINRDMTPFLSALPHYQPGFLHIRGIPLSKRYKFSSSYSIGAKKSKAYKDGYRTEHLDDFQSGSFV